VGFANKPSRMGRTFQTPGCVCVRGRLGLFCPANPPLRVKILELLKWKRAAWRDVTQTVGGNALIQNVKLSPWLCTCSLKVNTSSCWLCWLFKFLTREEFYRKSTPLQNCALENTFENHFLSLEREITITQMMDFEKWELCVQTETICLYKSHTLQLIIIQ